MFNGETALVERVAPDHFREREWGIGLCEFVDEGLSVVDMAAGLGIVGDSEDLLVVEGENPGFASMTQQEGRSGGYCSTPLG